MSRPDDVIRAVRGSPGFASAGQSCFGLLLGCRNALRSFVLQLLLNLHYASRQLLLLMPLSLQQSCPARATAANPQQQQHHHQQQLQLLWRLQASCAAALYPLGGCRAEAARQLVLDVLQESQLGQYEALRQYTQMQADRQAWDDVAKLSVRLLAKQPTDSKAQQLLACAVQVGSCRSFVLKGLLQCEP